MKSVLPCAISHLELRTIRYCRKFSDLHPLLHLWFYGEVATIKTQAENLVDIDTVLGPMLAKMDKTGQAAPLGLRGQHSIHGPALKVIIIVAPCGIK